ncbi:guanylate kinase [Pelosinus propionicus]|uniref:Guanylate kinase n=1 Tax=Pelosinus propionicus DSM 13327 TaxID=1123291 RepID=A0A1I4L149_9FIRM|nr:guanylate kinase [Pelosinus propionicus]SFL84563.1 guanylate kinase [Pelosinus propionicus DSM 13327]
MLIVLLGPTGSGKSTIEKKIGQSGIHRLRSYTTRLRKPGESEDAYYFVKKEEFKKVDLVESVLYKNSFFGLSREEVKIAETKDCVVTLDWNGAQQIKHRIPFAVTVFIDCPMYQLDKRLPTEIDSEKRKKIMEQVVLDSRCAANCDYIVRNYDGQLDEACAQILEICRQGKKCD